MKLRARRGPVLDERIYIPQHPALWGKRIAVFSDNGQDQSGFCEVFSLNRPPCTGGPGDIGYYCDTQGGSSGSPVLAYSDHRVVSLHHCANCPNRGLNISDVINSLGGNLPNCSVAQLEGTIEIDRAIYTCNDTILIDVVDDSIQGAGQYPVTLASNTEQFPPETLMLTETEPGMFSGSFPTSADPVLAGDGKLSLADGDTISVVYVDADDGLGGENIPRLVEAAADCAAPALVSTSVSLLSNSAVLAKWQTGEPSTGFLRYGTNPPFLLIAADDQLKTNHHLVLEVLVQCATYVYSVTSTDELGNSGTDDNGGDYFTFESACPPAPPVPDGVTATRLTEDGSEILVSWDDQCAGAETNLIYGALDQVSSYEVSGGRCSISQPETWNSVPEGDLWFLIVGVNPLGVESSWGHASGGERGDSASLVCGATDKDPFGSCP